MGEIHSRKFYICNKRENKKLQKKLKSKESQSVNKKIINKYSLENDFILISNIENGSNGKVYLCKLKKNNELLAIKSIDKPKSSHIKEFNNIKNEKKILKHLQHPFVIKLHFAFQDEKHLYLVMDYLSAGDLSYHIHKNSHLKEKTVKFILSEVYLAICFIHSKKIIHRDIKSENILLDSEGHVKLIDFGLAKKEIDNKNLTSSFCGTAECLPPEVIRHCPYSLNYDWWCFGILMYEMIYGHPPFRDICREGIFEQILNNDPVFNKGDITVSKPTIDLMKRLLCKNIDCRIKPEDIKRHEFFKGIDFDKVEKKVTVPPYLMKREEDGKFYLYEK